MGRIVVTSQLLFVLLPGACQSGATEVRPSRAECQRLREHVAGLLVDPARAGADPAEVEKHRRSLASVGGEESLARCAREQTREQIDCAMTAGSTEEVKRCLLSARGK